MVATYRFVATTCVTLSLFIMVIIMSTGQRVLEEGSSPDHRHIGMHHLAQQQKKGRRGHYHATKGAAAAPFIGFVDAAPPPKGKRAKPLAKDDPRRVHDHKLKDPIEHVHELTSTYFNQYLRPGPGMETRHWLVVFYTSWCGSNCDELIAPLVQLAGVVHDAKKKREFSIGKHDTTHDESVAHQFGIQGYPTVIFFHKEGDLTRRTVFQGERSLEGLLDFVTREMGVSHDAFSSPLPSP